MSVRLGASGAVASTLKARVAPPGFPAASTVRTRNVYGPSARGEDGVSVPLPEQGPKLGVPPSIEHSKARPGSELNVKVGVASLVSPDGPESILTTGGVVSTVQVTLAGVASILPARSIAR